MTTRAIKLLTVGAAAVLMLGAAGCTDTTVEPKSNVTGANVFNDPNSYKGFLAKLYAGLAVTGQQGPAGTNTTQDIKQIDEGYSQYLRVFWYLQELSTDEAIIGWGDPGVPVLNTDEWDAQNVWVSAMWARVYFQVGLANQFLRETTDAKLAERGQSGTQLAADVKTYRAEARFLRALAYWHGVDMFGAMPLVTEKDPLGSTPPKQASRTEVYNFVVSELQAIKGDLPNAGPSTYGRANKAAASMLLAKVYLNAKVYTGTARWAEALAATQDVINGGFTLDPNYRHLFMADNNTSPEIIFPVPFDGVHTQTWGGMTFLVHASCGGNNMDPALYGIDGCWWGTRLKPEAYRFFTAGDKRASYFFTAGHSVEIPAGGDGRPSGDYMAGVAAPKFTNKTSTGADGSSKSFPDTDFPLFRLGDAYLMYAEAVVQGGGGSRAQALQYVNALRQRAGVTPWTDADLTADNLLAERGRELLWEGQRRTDLIRFGKFSSGSYVWAWKGGSQAGKALLAGRDVFPIPYNEMVANPNLAQNTGY